MQDSNNPLITQASFNLHTSAHDADEEMSGMEGKDDGWNVFLDSSPISSQDQLSIHVVCT